MKKLPSILFTLIAATTMSASSILIFVGTYTPKESSSRGIYAVRFDSATGVLSEPVIAAETANPTFLALHPNGKVLYALGSVTDAKGVSSGGALSFKIDDAAPKLIPMNEQPTGGGGLAYLGTDATGQMLTTISYGGGQITSLGLTPTGEVGPRQSAFTSTGPLGPKTVRQEKPHPHSVTYSPDNRFAYVCDLGRDKILCYKIDPAKATLTPHGEFDSNPGDGPRHSKFSADGQCLYVINELSGTVAFYHCDPATGILSLQQTIPTLPEDFTGTNTTAEIRIHPNGRFVYGSNRGHNSLAVFARNSADGGLKRIQIISSGGAHPRNFALSPDGAWLICANRDSDNLVVFKVDPNTGQLTDTGHTSKVPQAVCVVFVPSASDAEAGKAK